MKFQGIYAPIVTPFSDDGEINYPVLEKLIEFLIENKVAGIIPGGTTGEVYALNDAERLEVFRFVKEKAGKRVVLMAGVNAGATRDVVRFSKKAEEMGYDALMVAVPPYSRPNQNELTNHFRTVAAAVSLPIVLYNFPFRAGSEVGYEVLDGLLETKNIVGIKEASGEMNRVYEMNIRYGERYQIICGSDDQALDYFLWGSRCWIGGVASCLPLHHHEILELALKNDFEGARKKMSKIMPLLRNAESGSYNQKVKFGCELRGLTPGIPRLPLLPLSGQEKEEFQRIFTAYLKS